MLGDECVFNVHCLAANYETVICVGSPGFLDTGHDVLLSEIILGVCIHCNLVWLRSKREKE